MSKIEKLETGNSYWAKHKKESVWKTSNVEEDTDGIQWLYVDGFVPIRVDELRHDTFEFVEIPTPEKLQEKEDELHKVVIRVYGFVNQIKASLALGGVTSSGIWGKVNALSEFLVEIGPDTVTQVAQQEKFEKMKAALERIAFNGPTADAAKIAKEGLE